MLLKPGLENSCLDVLPNWGWVWGPGVLVTMLYPGVLRLVTALVMVAMESRPRPTAGLWPPAIRGLEYGAWAGVEVEAEEGGTLGPLEEITGTDPNIITTALLVTHVSDHYKMTISNFLKSIQVKF